MNNMHPLTQLYFLLLLDISLQLNATNTEVMWCASSQRMLQVPAIPLCVGADNVTPISSVRDLGVYLGADASMTTHISQTAASCFGILRQLRNVQRSLPRHTVVSLVTSLVLTKLDYCNSLLVGLPAKLLNTPGRHQHCISSGLSCHEGRSHHTCVERPTLATNQERIQYKLCVLAFKCQHSLYTTLPVRPTSTSRSNEAQTVSEIIEFARSSYGAL